MRLSVDGTIGVGTVKGSLLNGSLFIVAFEDGRCRGGGLFPVKDFEGPQAANDPSSDPMTDPMTTMMIPWSGFIEFSPQTKRFL